MAQNGYTVEELYINLYYVFKAEFMKTKRLFEIEESLGLEELVLLHHVQSQWLSLVPALQCLVTIKDAVKKLLLEDMPKSEKNFSKNDKYLSVKRALESKEVDVEIEFIISIKPLFDGFMTKFQMEEPMIHMLYPSSVKVLKTAMSRLMKGKVYTEKYGAALKQVNVEDVELQLKIDQFKAMQGR